jgi:predicted nucleic acid-binding protein
VPLGKIQAGIERTREQDPPKASEIERWLGQVSDTFNIHSLDGTAFRCWAQLMHCQADTLFKDAMIDSIAKVHHLTVVTCNVADFSGFEVPLLNPFNPDRAPSGQAAKSTRLIRRPVGG